MTIQIMIVDDSIFIRALLKQMIEEDPQKRFRVVASAKDGVDALDKLNRFDIDVITMDVDMPRKNGLDTLKAIMGSSPKPVIMLSSLTTKGASETVQALAAGAFDFIAKPASQLELITLKDSLHEKLAAASMSANKGALERKMHHYSLNLPKEKAKKKALTNLVLIGCSTGGPKALQQFVSQLPVDFPAGIVVVQHMPEGGYTASLAQHLDAVSAFHVKEAEDGEPILDGNILLAPGGYHVEIFNRGGACKTVLNKRELVAGLRPSVDVLFASAARLQAAPPLYGIVLTGMGSDGLKGVRALCTKPVTIIAESADTAVIHGMPKQIIDNGLADHVLRLDEIVPVLRKLL